MASTEAGTAAHDDEQAIRRLVDRWLTATKTGDLETVLSLMDDDVVFMTPGKEPFGKEAFAANSREMAGHKIDGVSDIKEIQVLGDWAWMGNYLKIAITTPDGKTMRRSGFVLTILRKNSAGAWVIARDANLLTEG
ncbi:MAG TPA: SgcJ/EcaC family oxidoreductase [Pyrinomonadaceae bacterium]|nr:SgcJ/EcaC family oxidoreductase [Pyrinomonadaceae bacterium]